MQSGISEVQKLELDFIQANIKIACRWRMKTQAGKINPSKGQLTVRKRINKYALMSDSERWKLN